MIRFICFILLWAVSYASAQQVHNARAPFDPATVQLPKEQRGEIITLQINDSKVYPGTRREVQVYIPCQYTGEKDACLLVCMDGILYDATTVMDNLISTGEMPITIGVFIAPGVVYDKAGEVVRYNRCKEFDSVDDNLATFIETEVLPKVETLTTSSGKKVKLSKNPNDRCITGASSGGIASFSVAWHRPDLFSRVYTSVGTFVSMRGGNNYPAIVRKTEPKPLRIYMQDGWYDVWNPIFGEWFEYNQLMESALNFAGYELNFKWDRGNHSIRWGTLAFPDAMRWLWKGYPHPVEKGESRNSMLAEILNKDNDWQEIPLAKIPQSDIYALEDSAVVYATDKNVYKVSNEGEVTKVATLKSGELLMGKDLTMIGTKLYKQGLKVADGLYGLQAVQELADGTYVVLCDEKTKNKSNVFVVPNGCRSLAISPDNRSCVAGEPNSHHLLTTIVDKNKNMLYSEPFYYLHDTSNSTKYLSGSMTFDTNGNLYVATSMGVQVCDQNGRVRAILSLPTGRIDGLAFSGNYLYVLSGGRLFVRKMLSTGHNSWESVIKVQSQGQG